MKLYVLGDPNGIRTRAAAVKGRCPRPLNDGASGAVFCDCRKPSIRVIPNEGKTLIQQLPARVGGAETLTPSARIAVLLPARVGGASTDEHAAVTACLLPTCAGNAQSWEQVPLSWTGDPTNSGPTVYLQI